MKAIAISDISGGSAWSSSHDHPSWHYSSKRSQNMFHPVSLPREEQFTSKPSRVSRSLFGPSDPTESRRLEYEEFNSQRMSDRSRWNFDFHQEKPIAGRYDWRKTSFNGKDAKHGANEPVSDFMRSGSKSPKKYSSGNESFTDLKRVTGSSWSSLSDNSAFLSKTRSPDLKKKAY